MGDFSISGSFKQFNQIFDDSPAADDACDERTGTCYGLSQPAAAAPADAPPEAVAYDPYDDGAGYGVLAPPTKSPSQVNAECRAKAEANKAVCKDAAAAKAKEECDEGRTPVGDAPAGAADFFVFNDACVMAWLNGPTSYSVSYGRNWSSEYGHEFGISGGSQGVEGGYTHTRGQSAGGSVEFTYHVDPNASAEAACARAYQKERESCE